jgi:hypothetical protein
VTTTDAAELVFGLLLDLLGFLFVGGLQGFDVALALPAEI